MSALANLPAFPFPSGPEPRVNEFHDRCEGMTFRQYAAVAALQGLLAHSKETDAAVNEWHMPLLSSVAVKAADALIAELEGGAT